MLREERQRAFARGSARLGVVARMPVLVIETVLSASIDINRDLRPAGAEGGDPFRRQGGVLVADMRNHRAARLFGGEVIPTR